MPIHVGGMRINRIRCSGIGCSLHLLLMLFVMTSCSPKSTLDPVRIFQPFANPTGLNPESCRPCHSEKHETQIATAHFKTSSLPSNESILGDFSNDGNVLRTRNPKTYFKMEKKGASFFQTAYWSVDGGLDNRRSRTEQISIVVGAGIEGQSFLYWKNDFLYQLPVSYLSSVDGWVNSPGFPDGEVFFGRPVTPRCLECHGTYFELAGTSTNPRYRDNFQLGITCWKCHGDGGPHIEKHTSGVSINPSTDIVNPSKLTPERQLDICALCHSGVGQEKRAAFTFRPGQDLSTYLIRNTVSTPIRSEEVGGWLANKLFKQSKCFAKSSEATCSTCHDVHRNETGVAEMSQKCGKCHRDTQCPQYTTLGDQTADLCVDCHMPDQASRRLRIHRTDDTLSPLYRNHRIAIYKEATEVVLKRLKLDPD